MKNHTPVLLKPYRCWSNARHNENTATLTELFSILVHNENIDGVDLIFDHDGCMQLSFIKKEAFLEYGIYAFYNAIDTIYKTVLDRRGVQIENGKVACRTSYTGVEEISTLFND